MSALSPLKAVIFDLDGVLVSTSKFHAQAWADLVRSQGYEPPVDLEEQVRGISRLASLKIALGENVSNFSDEELVALGERKNACYLDAIKGICADDLYPGVLDLFNNLHNAGIAIVLGSASKNARPVLESLGIANFFDAVADGFVYTHGKPHPDVFLCGAQMVGATPAECIVVEDAAAGINAALDGGFVTVGMGSFDSLQHCHLFVNSLEELTVARLQELHADWRSDTWTIVREGAYDEKREESLQTVFCIGNGEIGLRGTLAELPVSCRPGIFIAGLFDITLRPGMDTEKWSPFMKYWSYPELATEPREEVCLIDCPNFLHTTWALNGEAIDFTTGKIEKFTRNLDMRSGMFTTTVHWVSPAGNELRFTQRRFADMQQTDRVFAQYEIEPLNCSGTLAIQGGIDARYIMSEPETPNDNHSAAFDILAMDSIGNQAVTLVIKGRHAGMTAAFASGTQVLDRPTATYQVQQEDHCITVCTEVQVEQGQLLYVERTAIVATARRHAEPLARVQQAIMETMTTLPFGQARVASTAQWQQYWLDSDVHIDGNLKDQLGARFSIYHLLIAGSHDDPGVSIAAKSLSGIGYRGMVFWDTDIHMTPFFNFTQPTIARNLAMFRYLTLDGARRKAAHYKHMGAEFPWETGISGDEECERFLKLITHQVHISADVAYALQQYVDITGDMEFYINCAAEVFMETARFWVSKAVVDGAMVSIPDAGGPDEFHIVSTDSAYVNNLAIYNLHAANRAIAYLKEHAPAKLADITARTGITAAELDAIRTYPSRIKTMQQPDGLFEQCAGFFALRDEIGNEEEITDIFNTQTVKQADVIMMLYLLPDQWDDAVKNINLAYYEPRTIHLSSLSHAVHGLLASELGLAATADKYIRQSLSMDLSDELGNTGKGAHMAANGMNWVSLVRGYGGSRPQGDHFLITPNLPADWQRLRFSLQWHGAQFTVDITHQGVTVSNAATAQPLPAIVSGLQLTLQPGEQVHIACEVAGQ